MAYLARWGCFINEDEMDPIEVAAAARERNRPDDNQYWHVLNLETGESTVVDLDDRCVLEQGRNMNDDDRSAWQQRVSAAIGAESV